MIMTILSAAIGCEAIIALFCWLSFAVTGSNTDLIAFPDTTCVVFVTMAYATLIAFVVTVIVIYWLVRQAPLVVRQLTIVSIAVAGCHTFFDVGSCIARADFSYIVFSDSRVIRVVLSLVCRDCLLIYAVSRATMRLVRWISSCLKASQMMVYCLVLFLLLLCWLLNTLEVIFTFLFRLIGIDPATDEFDALFCEWAKLFMTMFWNRRIRQHAATEIQAMWRGISARKVFLRSKVAAKQIQALLRRHNLRRKQAAEQIQALLRRHNLRRKHAAEQIQALWRRHNLRLALRPWIRHNLCLNLKPWGRTAAWIKALPLTYDDPESPLEKPVDIEEEWEAFNVLIYVKKMRIKERWSRFASHFAAAKENKQSEPPAAPVVITVQTTRMPVWGWCLIILAIAMAISAMAISASREHSRYCPLIL